MTVTTTVFHDGERAVQSRAGVFDEATHLSGMLGPPHFDGGMSRFLAGRDLAMLTGRDDDGHLWTSPLPGRPGFLIARASTLTVHAAPQPGDPLHRLPEGQQVAVMALDLAIRRRVRINGALTRSRDGELEISADQAYGNCPRYIQQRHICEDTSEVADIRVIARRHDRLEPGHVALIARADTFVLGSTHPTRGTDTSHRGGPPGFVRIEAGQLWWPDYPGNNLFNSLGNIVVDPTTALLFLDFATGAALHLSGSSTLEWTARGGAGDDGGTGRRVRFTPAQIVTTTGLPLRAFDLTPSGNNPPLT
ncbi:pyridoxamine 5'-phosphate oxidase [Pseudonocardia sp. CNS-004]|nr:pyridoxamine 5'-phosphate oxidase [Pseudonocardia sp. CNS-004]